MVSLSNSVFDFPSLARSLAGITASFRTDSSTLLGESATALESLCDRKLVSRKYEPIYFAIAGLALDAAGEGPRSRKPYTRLQQDTLPIDNFLGNSAHNSKIYTEMISYFGLRQFYSFTSKAEEIVRNLTTMQSSNEVKFVKDDNYLILMAILDLLMTYKEVVTSNATVRLSDLASTSKDLEDVTNTASCVPWLSLFSRLCSKTINSSVRRSILNLDLPQGFIQRLVDRGRVELWEPQMEAISKGILRGERLLMCTNTATGKTFLSSLIASRSEPQNKIVYLSPTRSLAEEVATKMDDYLKKTDLKVAISTREKTDADEIIGECSVIVATYEKFNSLLKREILDQSSIKTIVVDEVHKIAEHDRGITLEFIMARFNRLNGKAPQLLALSGMINDADVVSFSDWMRAGYIKSKWRPINLEEMILNEGVFHLKNGTTTDAGFVVSPTGSSVDKRMKATFRLVQSEVVNDGQCLVVLLSRAKVEMFAQELCELLKSSFNPDIVDLHQRDQGRREETVNKILEVEPELPLYARQLAEMIRFGIAYHHAGLPLKYRSLIEEAVRNKAIRTIVATTTLEAGVNLPVSMVIFPSPRDRTGKYTKMTTSSYRNLAGRAGRPEYDSKGTSVLIALTKEEIKQIRESYLDRDDDELRSGMMQFMKNVPETRFAVQTEILSLLGENSMSQEDVVDAIKNLWFWRKASEADKKAIPSKLSWEIEKLRRFECVEHVDGRIILKQTGRLVNHSMLYAFSIKNILDNCRRVMKGNYGSKQFDLLILSIVGIPNEMRSYDDIFKDLIVNPEAVFVTEVMKQDVDLKEKYDDTKYCAQFATILSYWIDSIKTEKIIELTGLKRTHAAFIEESLREDAYWILSVVSRMPNGILKLTDKQRKRIGELAKYCKVGSSDPVVLGLMDLGLKHLGRTTAIQISQFLKKARRDVVDISRKDLEDLFPGNIHCSNLLHEELIQALHAKQDNRIG